MAAGDGLVTMTPTSIAVAGAGSSASINSDGGVDFTAATSLSLNGVFTSGFDNYLLVLRSSVSTGTYLYYRLRAAGSDNSTASSYVSQSLFAGSTAISASRVTDNIGTLTYIYSPQRSGYSIAFFGPFLAQPTAVRTVSAASDNSAQIADYASTHNQSTSYDGLTVSSTEAVTGNIVVFGYEE